MRVPWTQTMLPASQRRTLEELRDDLDLATGDTVSKRSAFWAMLLISAVIAAAGVLSDSTATVIGAMIIAPLSTPIMGVALGVVVRAPRLTGRSVRTTVIGAGLVILVGIVFTFINPGETNLLSNSQISSRTSPGLLDLIAAIATGVAGAFALTRRDVAAVLPGVAIAISLVPPLVVVGVCAGQGAFALAFGALLLFLSNFVALVLMGTLVFTMAGYGSQPAEAAEASRRRAYTVIGSLLVLVFVALAANTVGTYLVAVWTTRVQVTADAWVTSVQGASVQGVDLVSGTFYVNVLSPVAPPSVQDLAADLKGEVPTGFGVAVSTVVGEVGASVPIE